MKLRIKGDSLRLRLAPSEVTRLLESGRIEETIHFAPAADARLTYALELSDDAKELTVCYRPGEAAVIVPAQSARQWAAGSDVGIYAGLSLVDTKLEIAVEKDFACLEKTAAENADTFPHPHQGRVC